ncbi:hypothetical protein I79_007266 [Cricetulus griseus]|nr:hypothetical protein I79_007266 [Cricetulus griseus]
MKSCLIEITLNAHPPRYDQRHSYLEIPSLPRYWVFKVSDMDMDIEKYESIL